MKGFCDFLENVFLEDSGEESHISLYYYASIFRKSSVYYLDTTLVGITFFPINSKNVLFLTTVR